jgi:hypothetical protein
MVPQLYQILFLKIVYSWITNYPTTNAIAFDYCRHVESEEF